MPTDKDSRTKRWQGWQARQREEGRAETRRILKTFTVLLIFFSKWVKLFYDFHRQFLATGSLFSRSPFFFLSFFHSFAGRCSASRAFSEAYFLVGEPSRESFLSSRIRVPVFFCRFPHLTNTD